MSGAPSPQQIADAVCRAMLEADRATRSLGMQVTAIGPGSAGVQMCVRDDMLNGVGTCHGGLITALADSAFAFACNSYNERCVAAALSIDFISPARLGDTLQAVATEVSRAGSSGVYDVAVNNQRGECVAVLRGRSHRLRGQSVVPVVPAEGLPR